MSFVICMVFMLMNLLWTLRSLNIFILLPYWRNELLENIPFFFIILSSLGYSISRDYDFSGSCNFVWVVGSLRIDCPSVGLDWRRQDVYV